jgi:hypothetical protein
MPVSSKKNNYWGLIVTAVIVAAILSLSLIWRIFQIDYDEGVNLGKAMLLDQGYGLYSDIWSDQPPVLTYILAGLIKLVGYSVAIPRLLIVAFSALLAWLSFSIMNNHASLGAALFASVLLVITDPFLGLSYAVMIGLPAISLALLSLYAIMRWHKSAKYAWLAFSAIILALSVMTKLFTGLMAPIFFLGLFIADFNKPDKELALWKRFLPTLVWTIIFSLLLALIVLVFVGIENIEQLISPHLEARAVNFYQDISFALPIPLLMLAGVGILFIVLDRNWLLLYPAAWMLLAMLLLLNQRPVWYHQALLFSVPAVLVAAYAANEGFVSLGFTRRNKSKPIKRDARSWLGLAALVLLLIVLYASIPEQIRQGENVPSLQSNLVQSFNQSQELTLSTVGDYAAKTNWIVTDIPMYAYRMGIIMPPNLVVMSSKRFLTGNLTEREIIETIVAYRPEQVLLGRFDYEDVVVFLGEDYRLLPYSEGKILHFVLKELVE